MFKIIENRVICGICGSEDVTVQKTAENLKEEIWITFTCNNCASKSEIKANGTSD
jgi:hypothetical protein